ncbi:hypothetical protein C9374_013488 [Naegleria lovaniensis]|uniref:Conserved oligomeric Golgi complex subunit 1 n=1 Tax=Naegleria lovaniensis TaxID=51637 RepID=A0AA88KNE4_NAELO|nr:uncharacterized protein C9374_013488 [Naegleria lovaniensis]KAG2392003.1 hypothetical protein C9374_013488 [Naegleria lovaniensis]
MVRTPTTPQRRASTAKQTPTTESSAAATLGSMSSYESMGDLFKKHAIKQIRRYKENIDEDISLKQNQLRDLVGERYKDIIEAADCMESIQQLCMASTNQFVEMTTLIDEYKNKSFETPSSQPMDNSAENINPKLQYKHLSQVIDWMLICVESNMFFYASICCIVIEKILNSNIARPIKSSVKIREFQRLKKKLIVNCKKAVRSQATDMNYIQCLLSLMLCEKQTDGEVLRSFLHERDLFIHEAARRNDDIPIRQKIQVIETVFDIFFDTIFISNNLFKCNGELLFLKQFLRKIMDVNFLSIATRMSLHGKQDHQFDLLSGEKTISTIYKGAFPKIFKQYAISSVESVMHNSFCSSDHGITIQNWIKEKVGHVHEFFTNMIYHTQNIHDLVTIKNKLREKIVDSATNEAEQRFPVILKSCCGFSPDFDNERAVRKLWKDMVINQIEPTSLWGLLNSSYTKKKHSLITSQFHSLIFNVDTTESISYTNIGEEIWKTPIIENDLLFDRFINNSRKNYFSSNPEDKTTFKSIITVHGTTKEVRRKVRNELFEDQLLPLCKDIFELIDDVQSTEEHTELQNLILNEYFQFFNNLAMSIQEAIRNPNTILRESSASLIEKQLYCARVLQSLRKLYIDLFLEIFTRLSLFGNSEDSFVSLMRKTKTQIANLKPKSKKAPLKDDMATNHIMKFLEIENRFGSVYLEAFEDWITKQSEHVVKQIQYELENDQQWNRPTRKELWQTFSNEKDGETFSLPFRTSYSVFNALHELAISIYSIGDFNIDKTVTDKLSEVTANRVFTTYIHWLESKIEDAKTLLNQQIEELNTSKTTLENSTTDKTQESYLNKIAEIDKQIEVLKEGPIPMEKIVCEEGFLQILFDVRYLAHVFFGSQLTYEKLVLKSPSSLDNNEKLFVKLGSLILDHIDPINWETFEKSFNISVLQCVNRNVLFTPNLCKTALLPLAKDQALFVGEAPSSPLASTSPPIGNTPIYSSSENDPSNAFFKLCKPEAITIHMLPIPKRELRMNYSHTSSHHMMDHLQDSTSYSHTTATSHHASDHHFPQEGGKTSVDTSSEPSAATTVFGSFFSSLISAQNQPQQKSETEKETPSRGFAFTWF